ncbi:MAG: tRNA 2-selenouridine(34) synthase MnmH, partial [Gammaproteobacteria bacterium]
DVMQPLVIGGRTGVGTTLLLQQLEQHIDLEGLYRHRGSSFGYRAHPQPSQIDIENSLAIALLKHRHNQVSKLVLEDEAPNIGSRSVPRGIMQAMQQAPLILIEADIDTRVEAVFEEYIHVALAEFQQLHGDALGFEIWATNLTEAMDRIRRRLGDQRHHQLRDIMNDAIEQQRQHANGDHHKDWIRCFLLDYYDPMYDYQIGKKSGMRGLNFSRWPVSQETG